MSDADSIELALEKLHSPIQEHHIDFLLEEEFESNPSFLEFFIEAALKSQETSAASFQPSAIFQPHNQFACRAVRSATTDAGESDVLVVYRSAEDATPWVAILIEDKIRARFQNRQAERYRERGEAGRGKPWNAFWTVLIAPQKYARDSADFDAYISLEKLEDFFKREKDARSIFKAGVLRRALDRFSATGVQDLHQGMTDFRRYYAELAQARFEGSSIRWDVPRDAYRGDYWFTFRSIELPRNLYITHKPKMANVSSGLVHLSIPDTHVDSLKAVFAKAVGVGEITAVQTSKSASFQLTIPPIQNFEPSLQNEVVIETAFQAVEKLLQFWKTNAHLLDSRVPEVSSLLPG